MSAIFPLLFSPSITTSILVPHRLCVCAPPLITNWLDDKLFKFVLIKLLLTAFASAGAMIMTFSPSRSLRCARRWDADFSFYSRRPEPVYRSFIQFIMWLIIIINIYARLCCRCNCWPSAAYRFKWFPCDLFIRRRSPSVDWHSRKRYADKFHYDRIEVISLSIKITNATEIRFSCEFLSISLLHF